MKILAIIGAVLGVVNLLALRWEVKRINARLDQK